jgi:predicted esterase
LLLPWKEVFPYHPFYRDPIGLNLCFVKAIGSKEKNLYFLKYDRRMQSELSHRDYLVVDFEKPGKDFDEYLAMRLLQRNILQGEAIPAEIIAHMRDNSEARLTIDILRDDSTRCQVTVKEVLLVSGWNWIPQEIDASNLVPGNYKLLWRFGMGKSYETSFTVLPFIDFVSDSIALEKLSGKISKGDYHTLRFMLNERSMEQVRLKDYETAAYLLQLCQHYYRNISEACSYPSALANQSGVKRRAFRSALDGSLQPYSVRLPDLYDPSRRYPLFVILHGSGSDDRDMLGKSLTGNQCIEIAPYGRGTSNCFAADGAVEDVREAIEDAILNYQVDTNRIILSGFSMGGYGAYRIFSEYPGLFRAIAVFSGHPSLASRWLGEGYPDYLEESRLQVFRDVPLFIYHSRNDINCPFSLTEELCNKLSKMGAKLDFVVAEESGHGLIDKDHQQDYYHWLSGILQN